MNSYERACSYILLVRVFHGWVHIGGEGRTRELQHMAEKVAGEGSAMHSVITLPRVTGESPDMPQRAVLPRIGTVIYGENREAGVVTQVVCQTDNRLVTHVVVRSGEVKDGNLAAGVNIVLVRISIW